MKNQKITTYQMAVTAVMAAVLCVLGPLTLPIRAIPNSLANFVNCLTAWLLGPKFGTLSVVIYLAIGLIGVPVFSGYGAGLAKVAGPTGGYLVGYLLLAFIGGLFIEKSNGQPVVSAVGLVLGDAACYVLGTAWFVFQMQCDLCTDCVRVSLHRAGSGQDRGVLHCGCPTAQASGAGRCAASERSLSPNLAPIL